MDMGLKGKIAVVTGGSVGLGREIARALAAEGATIAIVDIDEEGAGKVVEELEQSACRSVAVKTDVSKSDQVQAMVKTVIDQFNRIDILVNNAGIVGPQGPWSSLSEEGFDLVMGINFKGAYLCTKYIVPHMIKQKQGKIVMVSSCAAKTGEEYNGVYSASKAALLNFTQSLSKEVGQYDINVNAVCPAAMDTDLMEKVYRERSEFFGCSPDKLRKKIKSGYKLPHDLTVKDAADVVAFLAGNKTNMMTGQGVNITGGIEMH